MDSARVIVLDRLLECMRRVRPGSRALIAIDGIDGAGKSVLATELVARAVADGGRAVANVSIDGFHVPRSRRYARGKGPESFYRDSYDYDAFIYTVVEPFRAGEPIVPAVWDVDADVPVDPVRLDLPKDCVLLVDGIFLHRPQLRDLWDAGVWVDVPFEVSVPRGNQRYPDNFAVDPDDETNRRYVDGQRLYFAECSPWEHATWVVDNTALARPRLVTARSEPMRD